MKRFVCFLKGVLASKKSKPEFFNCKAINTENPVLLEALVFYEEKINEQIFEFNFLDENFNLYSETQTLMKRAKILNFEERKNEVLVYISKFLRDFEKNVRILEAKIAGNEVYDLESIKAIKNFVEEANETIKMKVEELLQAKTIMKFD